MLNRLPSRTWQPGCAQTRASERYHTALYGPRSLSACCRIDSHRPFPFTIRESQVLLSNNVAVTDESMSSLAAALPLSCVEVVELTLSGVSEPKREPIRRLCARNIAVRTSAIVHRPLHRLLLAVICARGTDQTAHRPLLVRAPTFPPSPPSEHFGPLENACACPSDPFTAVARWWRGYVDNQAATAIRCDGTCGKSPSRSVASNSKNGGRQTNPGSSFHLARAPSQTSRPQPGGGTRPVNSV